MKAQLTPSDLADETVSVEVPDSDFNPKTQVRFDLSQNILAMATTWNATQTFNTKGQPMDKDND